MRIFGPVSLPFFVHLPWTGFNFKLYVNFTFSFVDNGGMKC